jgi:hypothetical protein
MVSLVVMISFSHSALAIAGDGSHEIVEFE